MISNPISNFPYGQSSYEVISNFHTLEPENQEPSKERIKEMEGKRKKNKNNQFLKIK